MGRGQIQKRKFSAGTKFMVGLLAVVLLGSAAVLGRLSSGATVDLSKLQMSVLELQETFSPDDVMKTTETRKPEQENSVQTATVTVKPATEEKAVSENANASCTMTFGGSISLSGEVRKNSWNADAKMTDYSDVMMLLRPYVTACGFSQAYAAGKSGMEATLKVLDEQQIQATGIGRTEDSIFTTTNAGGVKAAFLQYTDTISSKTRKSMAKDGTEGLIPAAELSRITEDIASARAQGAEAVIVMLNWGKTGKDPDSKQRQLAEGIAQAGADLIIGNGSHVPQTAEYITGSNGKNVLCIWSLGTLLAGDRTNTKKVSGYLLHVTVQSDGQGGVDILRPEYTPVYTWKYKQDGRYYYHCVASNNTIPDGMDNDQRKKMADSANTVESVLQGSPVTERRQ